MQIQSTHEWNKWYKSMVLWEGIVMYIELQLDDTAYIG